MPLVYGLLCHHEPAAVLELFGLIHRPEHHYVLHADVKSSARLHATLAALGAAFPNVHVLPAALCSWGGWSLVATTLRAMEHACGLADEWSHFVLLSESHLPLLSPEATAAALVPGVSLVDAQPLDAMNGAARDDVLHRFAAHYQEVPGIGSFAAAPHAPPPAFVAALHHGSQWQVLARDACARLVAARDGPLSQPFRASLLPDETALTSLLLGSELGRGLAIERRATTFVAWEHLGGSAQMQFSERNFFDARLSGHLFIRKRPATLPAGVAADLTAMRTQAALPALPDMDEAAPGGEQVAALVAGLLERLQGRFAGLEVASLRPRLAAGSAACYLQFRWDRLPRHLLAALLSEDMAHYKVLLAWRKGPADFHAVTLGGYPTALLKVRLWELFEAREVLLPELTGGGFVTAPVEAAAAALVEPIARTLLAGAQLAAA